MTVTNNKALDQPGRDSLTTWIVLEAIESLLGEEYTTPESRRIKMALQTARLPTVKTLSGYDFSFQPSLDWNRVLALAELNFVARH